MTITLSLTWWVIPTVITVLAILWVFFWPADRDGMFGGLTTLFMLVPALLLSLVCWVAAAFLK